MAALILDLPEGYCEGHYGGLRYALTTETFAAGRSRKVYARELGGTDFISLNLYLTARGPLIKPCEMPLDKVAEFLVGVTLG